MENNFNYCVDNYLSRVELSLTALNRVSNEELLSMSLFNNALYELLYIATIGGVEEYLYHRLYHEVFDNEDNMLRYIKKYNDYRGRKKANKYQLKCIPPYSDEDIDAIKESIAVHQTYHNLNIVRSYFEAISNFDVNDCPSWDKLEQIINNRHLIVHHGARSNDGDKLVIKPYDVTQAYELAKKFILEVENAFIKIGKDRLIVRPDE